MLSLLELEDWVEFLDEPPKTIGPLLVALGVFPSRGEAKRNGWDWPFPTGWKHIKISRHNLWIWNPSKRADENDAQD